MSVYTSSAVSNSAASWALFSKIGIFLNTALTNFGWVQTNDTGQVQWSTVTITITGTQLTSNVATYFTSNTAGLRVGQSITVSGLTYNSSIFNITGLITNVTANTSFTLAKTNANISYAADSGTGTVSANSTIPTPHVYSIYEVWTMGDTLNSEAPCYLKLAYSLGSSSEVDMQISVGSGSNLTGTLTNANMVINQGNGVAYTLNNYFCYASGDTDRFSFLAWRDSTYPMFFTIERTKNSSGTNTSIGTMSAWAYRGNTATYKGFNYMTAAGISYTDASNIPCLAFSNSATLVSSAISVFPLFNPYGGVGNPMLTTLSGKASDFGELDQFSFSLYSGTSVNYLVSKLSNVYCQSQWGTGTNNALIMRYD